MARLPVDEIIGLIRENAAALSAWRDRYGNGIFHYLVGVRSEAQSVLSAAIGIDVRLLNKSNASGLTVMDMMDPRRAVLANRMILAREAKTAVGVGGQVAKASKRAI